MNTPLNDKYRKPLPGTDLDFFDAREAVNALEPGAWDGLILNTQPPGQPSQQQGSLYSVSVSSVLQEVFSTLMTLLMVDLWLNFVSLTPSISYLLSSAIPFFGVICILLTFRINGILIFK